MSYFPSNLGYIGIKTKQKTTAHTTVNKFISYLNENCDVEFDEVVFNEGGESYYTGAKTAVKTQYRSKISINSYLRPKTGAWLMGGLFGKSTFTASAATTPNYHTLTPKTTDLATTPAQPWLTVEKKITGTQVMSAYGVKFNAVTIEGEAGQPVQITAEGTGLHSLVKTTAQTDTYETDLPFSFYNGVFYVNAPTTSSFDIKSFSIKFNVNNDEAIQTVAITRQDIIRHSIGAEVTIGMNYTDFQNWKLANFGSTSATSPSTTYGYGSIDINMTYGSGASKRQFRMQIPKVKLTPHDVSLNPTPETLGYEMSGIAFKQSTTEIATITCGLALTTSLPAGI